MRPSPILLALARDDGSTASELAARLYPPLPIPARWTDAAQRRAVLGSPALPARKGAPAVAAVLGSRDIQQQEALAAVSRALGELVRRGYVEHIRPPVVAEWFRVRAQASGVSRALRRVVYPDKVGAETIAAWAAMVQAAEQSPGVWRPGKSGAQQETYAALVSYGVLVGSRQRWVTEAGRVMVSTWLEVSK